MAAYDLAGAIEGFSPLMRVLNEFATLDQFIGESAMVREELDYVAELAKEFIGTYQPPAGPFQGWPELAESTVQTRVREGYSPDEPLLREGDLRDAIQVMPDADGMGGSVGIPAGDPSAEKGYVQELGSLSGQIPERSFLRRAMWLAAPEIAAQWETVIRIALTGRGVAAAAGQAHLPPPHA